MNSWAKIIKRGTELGFEFWGTFHKMSIYKNGHLIATVTSFKQAKMLIL